ncbi:hypothetical protein IQ270_27090 [Microcoleus sp. LEGE 07076]|uniref:hypothetical protein n=1 Tax=Microcoleus sp. LEGE 07076 TaxID=915322 RepID=UPI00187FD0EB|nr:hypothetical protein [Microcoleus sp. LEGE 07076]MBE9188204.1 hypothetical protein [Microcoleus sp. LEGE 07076]
MLYQIRVWNPIYEALGVGRLCLTFWRFQPPNHQGNMLPGFGMIERIILPMLKGDRK